MKLTRDEVAAVTIRQVGSDYIRVGDDRISDNVVVKYDAVVRDWFPSDIEALSATDVQRILGWQPEIVILGTGRRLKRPPNEVVFTLARNQVGVEIMDTRAACRTFNILLAEGRRVVALLQLEAAG